LLALFGALFGGLGGSATAAPAVAPTDLEPGGLLVPLGTAQADLRAAYREPLALLYEGGRVHRVAGDAEALPASLRPGDLYVPPGEAGDGFCATCTRTQLSGTLPLTRAYALFPGRVAVLRSTATVPIGEAGGEAVAMWELAEIRQALDGYLLGAVPYDVLTEDEVAAELTGYDLLIVPAFRSDAYDAVISLLSEGGALDAIRAFVARGGALYAQGTGLFVAQAAGVLPESVMNRDDRVTLLPPDDVANRGVMQVTQPASPLAYGWLTDTLYILDDPILWPDEGGELKVIAELTNADWANPVPAVVRYPYGAGHLLGVVGHPTDPARRNELPLFVNALLLALSGPADVYGDAVQTFNPHYPPHEVPAYEVVPVSATLHVENLWDAPLTGAVVTETVSPGYVVTGPVAPTPTALLTDAQGATRIVWHLGDLAPGEALTLTYQAQTQPTVLAAGVGTFSEGVLAYVDPEGRPVRARHRPFVLTARMAARLVGDRDLEADRHYRIPAEGLHLDVTLPLENKEETLAASLVLTDWVYLLAPIVDIENQHVILNANDGETIWMRNEPFLWNGDYPTPTAATAPTQTFTLADWQGDWCVFTSTHGIHIDPPPLQGTTAITDYGSFVTIPPTYTAYLTVTAENELLLPCLPLTWELGDVPGYWYEEPAVRYGVHSRELFEREVRFHGTPREGTVVLPHDAGSVYVLAGTDPVPYRQYLEHAVPYAAAAPASPTLAWQDVWSRTFSMTLRASFYDVWAWDACATCGGVREQHAGVNLTYGLWADLDDDGAYETLVPEIPTRLPRTQLHLLGKTYSGTFGDVPHTIPPSENLIELPVFKGLGVMVRPAFEDWWHSYRSLAPGRSTLISVSEQVAYDHLFFQQEIPPGAAASFIVSATVKTYDINREGHFKIHDGARLIYRQQHAGPNRYEAYDGHVHAPEGWSSDGEVSKIAGPTAVSVYSDTLLFIYRFADLYDARPFDRVYDPFIKSWGYEDLVWTTYVGGREDKSLFHTTLGPGGRTRVRVSLDNNTGVTLTNLSVALDLPAGITATLLYTEATEATTPEPIWPELSFLNRAEVPDAWRSVWYFELEVGDVPEALWGQVLDIPVVVSAANLPPGYAAPPARLALQRDSDPQPMFVSAPGHGLVLTDTLPADVVLDAAALVTDAATLDALSLALDWDAGHVHSDTAGALFAGLPTTVPFTLDGDVVTFELPTDTLPTRKDAGTLVARAHLLRAQHGPNVVNAGAGICYRDPFDVAWCQQSPPVTVEAHGAALWVDYYCEGGWGPSSVPGTQQVASYNGECYLPEAPAEVVMDVTAFNAGDAIAKAVTVTVALPQGVTVTASTPPWAVLEGARVTWSLGDLAPGAWRQFQIIFYIEPDEGEWEPEGAAGDQGQRLLGIRHTQGAFFDDYSQRTIRGQFGGAHWFHVVRGPQALYLPVLVRGYDARPDLVVEVARVSPDDPSDLVLRVSNRGHSSARGFWVDLYFDPSAPPTANQPWPALCDTYGAAWQVAELAAGESVELTIDGAGYSSDDSQWPEAAYPAGDHELWAYVDTWSDAPWGWVQEADETNNRAGPEPFTAP
jgi:hypothetical protein